MRTAVFIVGPSRSGTSVLAEALGKHPEVTATEELHYYNLLKPAAERSNDDKRIVLAKLDAIQNEKRFFEIKNGDGVDLSCAPDVDSFATGGAALPEFFQQMAEENNTPLIVEQTPMNLYYVDEIRKDFPEGLFVLMKRDPRAILASQKARWKVGARGQRHHPERDLKRFRRAGHPLLQMLLLRKTLKLAASLENEPYVHCVVYENLVLEPEKTLSDLTQFLALDYISAMVQVSDKGSSHAKEAGRVGFDSGRLESWRATLNSTEIWLIERFFEAHLSLPKTDLRPSIKHLLTLVASFPWSTISALIYSVRSYGNIIEAIRKRFI